MSGVGVVIETFRWAVANGITPGFGLPQTLNCCWYWNPSLALGISSRCGRVGWISVFNSATLRCHLLPRISTRAVHSHVILKVMFEHFVLTFQYIGNCVMFDIFNELGFWSWPAGFLYLPLIHGKSCRQWVGIGYVGMCNTTSNQNKAYSKHDLRDRDV